MDFTPVEYKNVTMTEAEMLDLFYNKFGEIPLLSRMDAVADTFIDEVETLKNKDLPEEEKQEQALLRQEYLAAIRQSLEAQLDNVYIVEKDGTQTKLKKKGQGPLS